MNRTKKTMRSIMQSSQQGTCCCAMICYQNKQMMAFLTYSQTQPSFEKQGRQDNKQWDGQLYY